MYNYKYIGKLYHKLFHCNIHNFKSNHRINKTSDSLFKYFSQIPLGPC